jgi:hypothetical protein
MNHSYLTQFALYSLIFRNRINSRYTSVQSGLNIFGFESPLNTEHWMTKICTRFDKIYNYIVYYIGRVLHLFRCIIFTSGHIGDSFSLVKTDQSYLYLFLVSRHDGHWRADDT